MITSQLSMEVLPSIEEVHRIMRRSAYVAPNFPCPPDLGPVELVQPFQYGECYK